MKNERNLKNSLEIGHCITILCIGVKNINRQNQTDYV